MSKILYVKASPRGESSYSIRLANAFLQEYRSRHPDDEVVELDLFQAQLPAFGDLAAQGKYAIIYGKEASAEAKEAWGRVERVIEQFKGADKYVFAVPMWNFGIPYVLKHYVDLVTQPGYTFAVGKNGYAGLLEGRRAFVAYARGGAYTEGPAAAMDHQKPYFDQFLGFVGLSDPQTVVVEPTLGSQPESGRPALDEAISRARELARDF